MSERIRRALELADSAQMIVELKDAVADEVAAIDPELTIKRTDYFNHTFVPDLVLSWSGGERPLFLRRRVLSSEVAEDVDRLGKRDPFFFGLDDRVPTSPDEVEQVSGALQSNRSTLVTQPRAVDYFAPQTPASSSLMGAVGSAMVRGGRGLITEHEAEDLRTLSDDVLGASLASVDPAAMQTVLSRWDNHLQASYFKDLRRFLQLVWVLAGGDLQAVPGLRTAEAELLGQDDLARLLRYVLARGDGLDSETFWRRVSENVTLETFELLGQQDPSPNLHRLMQASSGRLAAKWVALKRWTHESSGAFAWRVADGFLALTDGIDVEMRFALSGERLARTVQSPGPTVGDLRERIGERKLLSLTTESGDIIASVKSRDTEADPTTEFVRLVEALPEDSRVSQADIRLAGSTATCDFIRRRLNTSSATTLRRLVRETSQIFGLEPQGREALDEFLDSGAYEEVELSEPENLIGDSEQTTLFDQLKSPEEGP
jgi:hypothetical protein